ncbi:MAG: cbb3-type cytochrome c oxidase subunit I [Lentisphaeria bacterium]|nr:cbb3-type cytochrome c oxidase subunit I [Lentisphaeria bacterium]NQZ69116.1 cbb3-type cytochrome c oxidase subunit I [Lentisphaeria bacterium]
MYDPQDNYLKSSSPVLSWAWIRGWLFTVDHKRIAILYFIVVMSAFALGGTYAILVRLELWHPNVIDPATGEMVKGIHGLLFYEGSTAAELMNTSGSEAYNRAFTMHGAVMVFLFIIPSTPAILGNFCLPIMVGAKDVAFPRLNLASWYIYMLGAIMALSTLYLGGVDTGWTFYTPYSSNYAAGGVIMMTLAAFVLGFSSIFTGLNFIVTVNKMRAPGMTWYDMPLFCWGIYATALVQVLATPVLAITLLLLAMENVFGIGIFDPAIGGDPVLFQHFFWFYSHPAVYIMILPGFAIISELIAVHSHKTIFGYKLIAWSSVMIAVLGFFVWGHHMFVSGESEYSAMIFSFLTFFIGIPSAIKVFNWMTTMYKGHIRLTVPMLFAIAFQINFAIGGLTGLFLGTLGLDVHLHSTYFVVAHFHYVMMGSGVFAFLGGIYHWWPKFTGRRFNHILGVISWALIFIGFNVTFLFQFEMGLHGMPRRYHDYAGFLKTEFFETFHGFSTWGALVLGLGFLVMLLTLVLSLINGKKSGPNPWGGLSMEWETTTPPPSHNFNYDPTLEHGPYDYDQIAPEEN